MNFSISYQPHIQMAHHYWQKYLLPGHSAIDATCGNGHDTLVLCQLILKNEDGQVYAYDIQDQALEMTRKRLEDHLSLNQLNRVHLIKSCHSNFSEITSSIGLIVYNLGYLPGGNKTKTTILQTTLQSIKKGCELLVQGGIISITCYPGHSAGALEEEGIIEFTSQLSRKAWSCCHHRWLNSQRAPSLFLLQKL